MGIAAWVFLGVVIAVIVWMTTAYNGLVALRHSSTDDPEDHSTAH